ALVSVGRNGEGRHRREGIQDFLLLVLGEGEQADRDLGLDLREGGNRQAGAKGEAVDQTVLHLTGEVVRAAELRLHIHAQLLEPEREVGARRTATRADTDGLALKVLDA